jgi:hypothetical protein
MTADLRERYPGGFGRFFSGKPSKETHLDQPRLGGVLPSEFLKSVIYREEDRWTINWYVSGFIDRNVNCPATPLSGLAGPGMIDQNLAHHLGSHTHKMTAALVVWLILPYKARISFVHQGSGLQSMPRALIPQISTG